MKKLQNSGKQFITKWSKQTGIWIEKIGKGNCLLLILAITALVLLSIPNDSKADRQKEDRNKADIKKQEDSNGEDKTLSYEEQLQIKLQKMLSNMQGVGKVEVMITLKDSGTQVLNKDVNQSESESKEENREENQWENQQETVIMEDQDGNQSPTVTKQLEPEVEGVLVLCEGGDQPQIIQNVTDAVEVLFSVSAHKVKVMKLQ